MKSLLAESPILLALLLGSIGAVCLVGWLKTGARGAIIGALVFFLLVPAGLMLESYWVTDREQIETTMYDVATALEENDHARVRAAVHPNASADVKRALELLPRITFETAEITGIRTIEVWANRTPPEATVDFNVRVKVSAYETRVPRRVYVDFWKQGDRWLVANFEEENIIGQANGDSDAAFRALLD